MPLYKFLGGYVDIVEKERLVDTIRRELEEEAWGLASLLDLSDTRLLRSRWLTLMNYRNERRESCTFGVVWMTDVESESVAAYVRHQNNALLLEASQGETSGLVLKSLLDVLEETFSADVNRRKLPFPYGFLEHLEAILPLLDPQRLAAIWQLMAKREAEKEK